MPAKPGDALSDIAEYCTQIYFPFIFTIHTAIIRCGWSMNSYFSLLQTVALPRVYLFKKYYALSLVYIHILFLWFLCWYADQTFQNNESLCAILLYIKYVEFFESDAI
jgi:hypothetical protein